MPSFVVQPPPHPSPHKPCADDSEELLLKENRIDFLNSCDANRSGYEPLHLWGPGLRLAQ